MLSTFISRPRNLSILIGVSAVLFVVFGGISAQAQSGGRAVTGWAWSSNIGWISFNGAGYGVSENPGTGALSGYAWSSNIRWISFNSAAVSGCPSGSCAPRVDLSTGNLSGWARACAAFADKDACSGALDPNSGGWDGWIALSGTSVDGSVLYGVTQSNSTGAWSGFAWGSDTVGAISMGGTINGVPYGVFGICSGPCSGATSPQAFLYASPDTIAPGGSADLNWSSTNATSCTGTGFTAGGPSGNRPTGTLNTPGTYPYQVVCRNGSGPDSPPASAIVTVLAPYTLTISANPARVRSGSSSSISWSASGVESCIVSGPGLTTVSGDADASNNFSTGSPQTVPTISRQSTFTITCQAGDSSVARSVVVNLLHSFQEF